MTQKILWLYQYAPKYNFDHFLHMSFVSVIKRCGVDIRAYGPKIEIGYPELALCNYQDTLTIGDLYRNFKFDCVIINTKSRMFEHYWPPVINGGLEKRIGEWTPKDIKKLGAPVICIEEDYHYEKDNNWYLEVGVNLILQRHYNSWLRCAEHKDLDVGWFPFSVDTTLFNSRGNKRQNQICFAGSASVSAYPHRDNVKRMLSSCGLLKDFGSSKKDFDYVECLQDYVSHLSCSSVYSITPAKMFEIAASGSVLFTNEETDSIKYGLAEVFPREGYVTYKNDYSDVVSKAKLILGSKDFREYIVSLALRDIKEFHTHEIRIEQLINICKGML